MLLNYKILTNSNNILKNKKNKITQYFIQQICKKYFKHTFLDYLLYIQKSLNFNFIPFIFQQTLIQRTSKFFKHFHFLKKKKNF